MTAYLCIFRYSRPCIHWYNDQTTSYQRLSISRGSIQHVAVRTTRNLKSESSWNADSNKRPKDCPWGRVKDYFLSHWNKTTARCNKITIVFFNQTYLHCFIETTPLAFSFSARASCRVSNQPQWRVSRYLVSTRQEWSHEFSLSWETS